MTDFEVPELDGFAIDFPAFLSRLAPSIYRYMPITRKAPRKLVRDDYNRVIAFRGYVVPRLAYDGHPPDAPRHAILHLRYSDRLLTTDHRRGVGRPSPPSGVGIIRRKSGSQRTSMGRLHGEALSNQRRRGVAVSREPRRCGHVGYERDEL